MIAINRSCIACDLCRLECPVGCISEGDPIYLVDNRKCVKCKSYYEYPKCIMVCPVEAIVDSNHQKSAWPE